MTPGVSRVATVRTLKRALSVNRLPGGGLSGGWYDISIDRGPPIPAVGIQLNLADLRRLRDDLTKEIDRAATLGG